MILGLKLTFLIDGKEQEAVKVNQTKGNYEINGTKKWECIKLKDEDLKYLDEYDKKIISWENIGYNKLWCNKPKSLGKYKIKYNNVDYYVSTKDELELFNQVVFKSYGNSLWQTLGYK